MKSKARSLMRESAAVLKEVFQDGLAGISAAIVKQVMARYRALPHASRARAVTDKIAWTGEAEYRRVVLEIMAEISADAIAGARKEIPKAKNVELSEKAEALLFAETAIFEELPTGLQQKLKKRAELLVGMQLTDLQSTIFFQYMNSFDTTEDPRILEDDLRQAAAEYVSGTAISAGAELTAANTVNTARNAFFLDDEVKAQLDAFQFVNGDPVTPICQDLNGVVFAVDDPNLVRYTPPLHWNCKSYIQPILVGDLGNRKIEALKPSTKELDDSIQFAEHLSYAAKGYAQNCNGHEGACSHS